MTRCPKHGHTELYKPYCQQCRYERIMKIREQQRCKND